MSHAIKRQPAWKELAALVASQRDENKALVLAQELIRALDAESKKTLDDVTPESKMSAACRD
jgi:hypothetical protein